MANIEKALNLVNPELKQIETIMLEQFKQNSFPAIESVGEHIIKNGGKRLRPMLLLLSSLALDYSSSNRLYLASVIELIHTATLLHDDVIDLSPLRRSELTAHEIWGNRTSILVGDFLFTRALELTSEHANENWGITTLLAKTLNGITVGEVIQLKHHFNPHLEENIYFDIIEKKTALLFAAACEIPALLTNKDELRASLYDYGLNLGIAFQLIDDLLDYESDEATLGKSLGDDLAEGKATLPYIHAISHSDNKPVLLEALKKGDKSSIELLISIMKQEGSFEYTRKVANAYVDKAITALTPLESNKGKEALLEVAQYAIERHH